MNKNRKMRLAAIAVAVGLLMGGCSQIPQEKEFRQENIEINFDEAACTAVERMEIELDREKNEVIGDVTATEDGVFYMICNEEPGLDRFLKCAVYRMDEAGNSTLITEIENDGNFFYVNELVVSGDALFWVYRDGNELSVVEYDMTKGVEQRLVTCEPEMSDLILSADERFLVWYMPGETGVQLLAYDRQSGERFTITSGSATDSPYTRPYLNDGVVSYLKKDGETQTVFLYDLEQRKTVVSHELPKELEVTRLQGNTEYVVCTNGYSSDPAIYVLDLQEDTLYQVELPLENCNVFYCRLMQNKVTAYLSSSKDVVAIDLQNKTAVRVPVGNDLLQSTVTPDGTLYAHNMKDSATVEICKITVQ